MEIKELNYELSNNAMGHWDCPVPGRLTVNNDLRAIADNRRERYIIAEGGVGCRHWTYVHIGFNGSYLQSAEWHVCIQV